MIDYSFNLHEPVRQLGPKPNINNKEIVISKFKNVKSRWIPFSEFPPEINRMVLIKLDNKIYYGNKISGSVMNYKLINTELEINFFNEDKLKSAFWHKLPNMPIEKCPCLNWGTIISNDVEWTKLPEEDHHSYCDGDGEPVTNGIIERKEF